MFDDELVTGTLRSLPRIGASPGFRERALASLETAAAERRSPRWRAALVPALVAGCAAAVAAVAWFSAAGAGLGSGAGRAAAPARLARERARIDAELAALEATVARERPTVRLVSDRGETVALDLRSLADLERRLRHAAAAADSETKKF